MKREPLMDETYFAARIPRVSQRILEMPQKLAVSTGTAEDKADYVFALFLKHYEFLLLRYSAGHAVQELVSAIPDLIRAGESYQSMALEAYDVKDRSPRPTFMTTLDEYMVPLSLISLGILLRLDDALFKRLVDLADGEERISNEGQDLLFERLVTTRISDRKKAQTLLYPKAYQPLYDVFDAPAEKQLQLLKKFLTGWYTKTKDVYWHDNYKGPDGGGFFGYWATEAAAVVVACGIDDSSFQDMPYYPKDLVTYYRQQK